MKTKTCLTCNIIFSKPAYISKRNWEKVKFCSLVCFGGSKKTLINVICNYCNNYLLVKPSATKRYKKHFCCRGCYSKYRTERMPMQEHNSYKGVRKEGESKQVYHRNYCKSNPENIAHLKARRYAREKNAEGSHTLIEWNELKMKFNQRCAICNELKKLTKDHIIPLSEGGADFIGNIQPLCKNCNSRKWKFIYEHPHLLK